MGYYNNINKYDGHSNPWFIWRNKDYPFGLSFEEKVELWKRDAIERNRECVREHKNSDGIKVKAENSKRRKIALKKKNGGVN